MMPSELGRSKLLTLLSTGSRGHRRGEVIARRGEGARSV
jgi:hypothetical protein